MSDLDALAEGARNRGLKLVRSRVRTPGKRGFGKVGLTDASGKPVLGMDGGAPSATPEEAEAYLRNMGASDWSASLDAADLPKPKPKAKASTQPRPAPKPKPPPKPEVRAAGAADASKLAELLALLGVTIDAKTVRRNLAALEELGEPALVATVDSQVVGLCGMHRMVAVHRPVPLGRVNVLVVAAEARGKGIGRMLLDAAEAALRKAGCREMEITSNDRLTEAHAFYRHLGFERTSIRFLKPL